MNPSKPFIYRPVLTSLAMLTLILFGALAFKLLPVSSLPELEYPVIQVTTNYPGASPDQIGRLVSSPLERQFMLMQGIEFVISSNTYQQSQIVLQFHLGTDINVAAQETQQAIQMAQSQLPKDLPQQPTYVKFNPSDTPFIYTIIHSPTRELGDIYNYGYNFLGQQFGTVPGVANIQIYGYPYAVRVKVDPEALAAKNVSLGEVANAIKAGNPDKPTGKFYGPSISISTESEGMLPLAKDYPNLIIKFVDGKPLRLRDIATIDDSVQNDKQNFFWITKDHPEGVGACVLALYKQMGANTVETANGIDALIDKLGPDLPKSIQVSVPFSLALWIQEAVKDVEVTLAIAFLLVVIVVYAYLGKLKNSLIPLITLPITITGTFIFMWLFGYTLDIMSLSALTLAIGFLIDDAIVVLENIVRWSQEKKLSPFESAVLGSKQIVIVVVAISLCLASVFTPMLFLGGAMGQLFHEFAGVIIIATLFSGFISLSLTPMLSSRFLGRYDSEKVTRMERISLKLNDRLLKVYDPWLKRSLKHRWVILVMSFVCIVASGILIAITPKEFLPDTDLGCIQGFLQSVEGTSPEKMEGYLKDVGKIMVNNPYVASVAGIVSTPTDSQSLFFCSLVDADLRPDIWTIMSQIHEQAEKITGVKLFQKAFPLINLQVGGTNSGKANYQYMLQSFDEDKLYKGAIAFIDKMQASSKLIHVTSDFQPNAPVLKVNLLRDQAESFGQINAGMIEDTLMYAYGETYISRINVPEDMYYVILEVKDRFQHNPNGLDSLYMSNLDRGTNDQVSSRSVTTTQMVTRPEMVNHVNTIPSVTVVFDPKPGVPLSDALTEVETIANQTLGDSIIRSFVGNTQAFQQAMVQFLGLVVLALFVIYVILGILYENFLHPITALSAVPVALLGGILTLIIFGEVLSIYAIIGLIMLLGIVMKNGILIIDFALELIETDKLSPHDAIYQACLLRFRPIIMTTIAAMAGALPVAIGAGGAIAAGRAPLGIAIVGGLAFAQIASLFVCPVIFLYMYDLQDRITTKWPIFRAKQSDE